MQDGTFSELGSLDDIYKGAYDPDICPVRHVLKGIAEKWSILVLAGLKADQQRFSDLRRLVPDVSQRMLTQTLRRLERDGYVSRHVTPSIPPRVDYALTELGRSLVDCLAPLAKWASSHREDVGAARLKYDSTQKTT